MADSHSFESTKEFIVSPVSSGVDAHKSTMYALITSFFESNKANLRYNSLLIVQSLLTNQDLLEQHIKSQSIKSYFNMIDTPLRDLKGALNKAMYEYKNLCLDILSQMYENEPGDHLKVQLPKSTRLSLHRKERERSRAWKSF